MQMPAALPPQLRYCGQAVSNKELLALLQPTIGDLERFLVVACNDETWLSAHKPFVVGALQLLTSLSFKGQLPLEFAMPIVKTIQYHYHLIKELLPADLICELQEHDVAINSLVFRTLSPFFYQVISAKSIVPGTMRLPLRQFQFREFAAVQEYFYTGEVANLWNFPPEQLVDLQRIAVMLELQPLAEQCEFFLRNYVDADNLFEYLELSVRYRWPTIKALCCEHIAALDAGLVLLPLPEGQLGCEIEAITVRTLELFAFIRRLVTLLVCKGKIVEEREFPSLLQGCMALRTVDISQIEGFHHHLSALPNTLFELLLSDCPWLTNQLLKDILHFCPSIQRLALANCGQLSVAVWGGLLKLRRLHALDLARNLQLTDEELALILRSARSLVELDISECHQLSPRGFQLLGRSRHSWTILNLSRTAIDDSALLEIVSRMPELEVLRIARCLELTEQGITAALQQSSKRLRFVDLQGSLFPYGAIEALHRSLPAVEIRL